MGKETLKVFLENDVYVIGWELEDEDGDIGAVLGEGESNEWILNQAEKLKNNTLEPEDDIEHIIACKTILMSTIPRERNRDGAFVFKTEKNAKKQLIEIKMLIEAHNAKKPWPEWALTALSNGWKPPRGWKI